MALYSIFYHALAASAEALTYHALAVSIEPISYHALAESAEAWHSILNLNLRGIESSSLTNCDSDVEACGSERC